jgi:hypothetical protein
VPKDPPFDLDPHVAIHSPETLPAMMINGMYSVMQKAKGGTLAERFISAFNITAWSLTTAGRRKSKPASTTQRRAQLGRKRVNRHRTESWQQEGREARLKKGTLEPTTLGKRLEEEARKTPQHDAKRTWIETQAARIHRSNEDYYNQSWQQVHGRG